MFIIADSNIAVNCDRIRIVEFSFSEVESPETKEVTGGFVEIAARLDNGENVVILHHFYKNDGKRDFLARLSARALDLMCILLDTLNGKNDEWFTCDITSLTTSGTEED